jgi:hypothetical protein
MAVRQLPCAICGRPAYIVHQGDLTGGERPLCRDHLPEGAEDSAADLRSAWERAHPDRPSES